MRRWRTSFWETVRMTWRRAEGHVVIVEGSVDGVGSVGAGLGGCGC